MCYIDSIIQNEWTTPPMHKKKLLALKLKYFTPRKYDSLLADTQDNNKLRSVLKELYELKVFSDDLNPAELNEDHKTKLNKFYNFIEEIKTRGYEPGCYEINDVAQNETKVIYLKNKFKKHKKFQELEVLLIDFYSSINLHKKHKKIKAYDNLQENLKKDYHNIKSLIQELKNEEDIQSHELEKLVNDDKQIGYKLNKTLSMLETQKQKALKKKRFSYIIKFVAGLAFIASILELGKFYSENGEEIKNYFNTKFQPKTESVKKDLMEETIFYYLR